MASARTQYQGRDHDVVDYQLYELPGVPVKARGPRPKRLRKGQHIACLGAAQTFGALCAHPWPAMLEEKIGVPTFNLGFGGAGPSFFLMNPKLIELANQSALAIVQVMSGRPVRNSYFDVRGGTNFLRRRGTKEPFVPGDTAFQTMIEQIGPKAVQLILQEIRSNWVHEMELLIEAIRVPVVFFWFSKRSPDYVERFGNARQMMGLFPQCINGPMIEQLKPDTAAYVECITERGMPHILRSRFTGQNTTAILGDDKKTQKKNTYYPSPEMHEDAVASLVPTVSDIMAN